MVCKVHSRYSACLLFSSHKLQQINNKLIKSLKFWMANFVVVFAENARKVFIDRHVTSNKFT